VAPGEVLGVIGPNGAGKSTLMKMVARVLPPTKGRVVVRGLVAPMIELGAGFNPEMTAYENIILYGTLLGRTPGQMQERVASICDWADLNDFIDVPTRSYSSGMLARLGFSVATDIHPEVLVVDEVLSVGDAAFQEKSKHRMMEMIDHGAAVLFVSHALETVKQLSDRVLWLDHGTVQGVGGPSEVVSAYRATFADEQDEQLDE
jgi:ABC-type polysaccharide/polyol phosphate transport system ATPase subunit